MTWQSPSTNWSSGRPLSELANGVTRTGSCCDELLLSEIRELTGKSQEEVAKAIGIRQPSLSKLEKQSDMQLSTFQRIVKALGGKLEVIARFPNGAVKIDQFDKARQAVATRSVST